MTIVDGHIRATGVGPFQIRITQDGDALRYLPATPEIYDGDVQAARLTAQLQPARRFYGGPNPQPQFTFSGLANGDTAAVVSGVTTFTQPPATYPAGTAGVQITRVLTAPNYLIEYDTSAAQMLIDRAPLTIKLHDLTKIYGQPTPPITFEDVGLVLGETAPSQASGLSLIRGWPQSPNGDATLPAGTYPISASQESTNYEITVDDGTLTVSQAPLTITADDKSRAFGAPNPPFTVSYSTFVNGESPATALTGALTFSTNCDGDEPWRQLCDHTERRDGGQLRHYIRARNADDRGAGADDRRREREPVLRRSESCLRAHLHDRRRARCSRHGGDQRIVLGHHDGDTRQQCRHVYAHPWWFHVVVLRHQLRSGNADDRSVAAERHRGGQHQEIWRAQSVIRGGLHRIQAESDRERAWRNADVHRTRGQRSDRQPQRDASRIDVIKLRALIRARLDGDHDRAFDDAARTKSRYYGAAMPPFTIDYVGLAGGDTPDSIGGTVTTTATQSSVPGDYALVVSGGATGNYDVTRLDGTLRIDKAILTVDIGLASRLYGDDNSTITYTVTYSPFVLGQDASILEGTLRLSTPAMPRSEGGIYDVTLSGLSSSLYDIIFLQGSLLIDARPLLLSGTNITRTYGEPRTPPSASLLTYTGFLPGDGPSMLEGTVRFLENETESSDAGTYQVTPIGLFGWPNYKVISKPFSVIVHSAPLVVRTNDVTTNFGEALPEFTVSYEGFVFGQDVSVVTGTPFFTPNRFQRFQVGQHAITPSGVQAHNYVPQYVAGTLTVKSVPLVITAVDASRLYGHADPSFAVTYSGLVPGDTPQTALQGALTFTTPATESSSTGDYPITPGGVTARNYDVEFGAGTLTVTPSPLTVKAIAQHHRYGLGNQPFTVSYSGFLAGDGPASLGGALTFTAPGAEAPVGTYAVVPGGLTSANYTIAFEPGSFRVDRAILTVTANDATRKFGMPNPAFTVRYEGFKNGEGPEVLQGLVVWSPADETAPVGGFYEIYATGLVAANYEFDYLPGRLTIVRATLTVTAGDASRPYGSFNPAFTTTYSGLIPGTENQVLGAVTFTTSGQILQPIGDTDIVPAGLFSTIYDFVYVPGTLTITRAPLTVHANNASRLYGVPNPAFTAFFTGFRNGDTESVVQGTPTFTTAADQFSPVGNVRHRPVGIRPHGAQLFRCSSSRTRTADDHESNAASVVDESA